MFLEQWFGQDLVNSQSVCTRACMRVVEMSVQTQANAQTGRAGVAITNATGSQPRSGGVKPNFACKLQLYLCETSVDLGILDYSQRFVGEHSQRSRQGQGFLVLACVDDGHYGCCKLVPYTASTCNPKLP
jgi:hypothetical protein